MSAPRWSAIPSLQARVGAVFTGLAACVLLFCAGLWLQGARNTAHEEVEAATRVNERWLQVLIASEAERDAASERRRLLAVAASLGRIRAATLEILGSDGQMLYRSPPPTYKAGRSAPDWFATVMAPDFPAQRLQAAGLTLVLTPDASRAVLDAWDDLRSIAAGAAALLLLIFVATRLALAHSMRPLSLVMAALDAMGGGSFTTRLPQFRSRELARLAQAFNGMADRLHAAIEENVRLDVERELAQQRQTLLAQERRDIARELHDELAQGITAVRALAGAICQRTDGDSPTDAGELGGYARGIVDVSGEMQRGVRAILQRLAPKSGSGLEATLHEALAGWRRQHPEIALRSDVEFGAEALSDALAFAVLRIVQEGLTNVARHAGADRVELAVRRSGGWLRLRLADNGRGEAQAATAGCGLGLRGMAERVAGLGGFIDIERPAGGGFVLHAALPEPAAKRTAATASDEK